MRANAKKLSPLQSIKKYCKLQCCQNDRESWKNCTLNYCFLWNFRLGKRNTSQIKSNSSKQGSTSLGSIKIEPSGDEDN